MLTHSKQAICATLKRKVKSAIHAARTYIPFYCRYQCPICGGWERRFSPFGQPRRINAKCPSCGALERHRLVWLFLQRCTDVLSSCGRKMLHFAPEACISTRLQHIPGLDYTTVDLLDRSVMVQADITALPFEDETVDVIYCSHVLEHVIEDRMAIRECRRVLKQSGYAIILVPISADSTFEDVTVTDPRQRELLFGQSDHVRRYGPDFANRLRSCGFDVTAISPTDVMDLRETSRFAIPTSEGPIFLCRRDSSEPPTPEPSEVAMIQSHVNHKL